MKPDEKIRMHHYIDIKRTYFDNAFLPAFSQLAANISPVEKNFTIAGKHIRLKFYTPHLAEFMTHALNHHPQPISDNPDFTIHLFDSVGTGMNIPAPEKSSPRDLGDPSFSGVYWYDDTLNFYDSKTRTAYFWTHDAAKLPNWVGAAPLRGIFHWLFSDHNMHLVHGSIVGDKNNTLLLSAKSGSGKSTTALSCLLSDMVYVSDDYSIIEPGNTITAHNLYNSVKVLPDGFSKFPELHHHTIWNDYEFKNGTDAKAMIFMRDAFTKSAPLSAILIPKITGGETKIIPATKMEAMLALLPSTLFQLPLPSTAKIEALKKIIADTPCYTLELGSDVRGVPGVIKDFLKNNHSS